jgi:hypothetical protein
LPYRNLLRGHTHSLVVNKHLNSRGEEVNLKLDSFSENDGSHSFCLVIHLNGSSEDGGILPRGSTSPIDANTRVTQAAMGRHISASVSSKLSSSIMRDERHIRVRDPRWQRGVRVLPWDIRQPLADALILRAEPV